jgi:hypothetical protein
MTRGAGASACAVLAVLALCGACGSYDTGAPDDAQAERACLDTVDAFARAAERCGGDYKTSYDSFLRRDANGDCKNVSSIRDENALRKTCIPFVQSEACDDLTNGVTDPSCAAQLQRRL